MKRGDKTFLVVALLSAASVSAQAPAGAAAGNEGLSPAAIATRAKAQNVPEIHWESAPNLLKLPPNLYLGEGIGVATNSKGHIFVYTRSQATRLFEFDRNGTYIREIGQGLYGFVFAHAVRVDPQDNIWAVDEGANMIIKFNPEGRVVMTMGRRPEPPDALAGAPVPPNPANPGKYIFDRPSDVGWDPDGNIFVSDGYGNSRIVKYDKNGKFITQAGTKGSEPGQLNLPHSLAVDAKGNVYVADRTNRRIEIFDDDLKYKTLYDNVGTPWELCISPGPHQYLYSSNTFPDSNDYTLASVTGEVYKMELDGTILGKFGKAGKQLGEFSGLHEIDCRNPDELYTSEIQLWRVQKILLHPNGK
jgi:DNA-binding beta-propeller fold protein YncE